MGSHHIDDSRFGGRHLVSRRTCAVWRIRAGHHAGDRFLVSQERGNAPAEFVMVSALLVALVLGITQVIMVGYVRHTLIAAAAEGARQAGLADVSPEAAIHHTRALVTASLSPRYAENIRVSRSDVVGIPSALVSITAPFPALGLWSMGGVLEVEAHAPLERAR